MAADDTKVIVLAPEPVLLRIAKTIRTLRRYPLIPLAMLLVVLVAGIGANWLAPHDPENAGDLSDRVQPPFWQGAAFLEKAVVEKVAVGQRFREVSLEEARAIKEDVVVGDRLDVQIRAAGTTKFLLGTDHIGRDILSRLIFGARISLIISAVTLGVGGTVGIVVGLVSGWYGGWIDELIMRTVDIFLSVPLILVTLFLVTVFGQSLNLIIFVLALWIWPYFARMIRGEVLQLKTMDYVALARVAGASTPRIMFQHLFPGTINTLIVIATLQVGIVMLVEATLSFLGAGVPPPTPAWGSMVADGRDRLSDGWWIATMPGLAVMFTVMSLNLCGDWLRDTLDPRLRQLR